MPALLHFYGGAITRTDFWDMPGDELDALVQFRNEYVKAMQR